MRRGFLIAVLCCLAQAMSLAAAGPVRAEEAKTAAPEAAPIKRVLPWERDAKTASPPSAPESDDDAAKPAPAAAAPDVPEDADAKPETADTPAEPTPVSAPEASPPADKKPDAEPVPEAAQATAPEKEAEPAANAPAPPHPVVATIREQLKNPKIGKDVDEEDLAALRAFYAAWTGGPLWITEMGFTAKGQAVVFEIESADEWGLDPKDFDVPDAGVLPENEAAQARAEIALDLAILHYARFARGGRYTPAEIDEVLDQAPPLRAPGEVVAGIAEAPQPDAYLRALHPKHEQFKLLRAALLKARAEETKTDKDAKKKETDIRRLVMNMERWRWMPEDLGPLYVWLNTPEFMLYVVKDGKTIFDDKTLVGTIGYPTPVFSADMRTIVFNPDWIAPPSVLKDKLLPALRQKHYNILKSNKLLVSYNGKPIDPSRVNWSRVNILNFTFKQKSGPKNVLGKAKFLYPNKHVVYMHDTLPYRRKVFKEKTRAIGYGCVRMENPREFAELLLAEDKDWPASKVKELWDKGVNRAVELDNLPPVHTTYFTAVADADGKVSTFEDIYGIDREMAVVMFGESDGFPKPRTSAASGSTRPRAASAGFARSAGIADD